MTAVVCACLFCGTAHGQRPITQPELLSGPWELTDESGIDGIFLSLGTHARGTSDPVIASQSINIRVYHRQNGHETWGWYSAASANGTADAGTMFDGRRLQIRNDRVGLLLDLTFNAGAHRWTGTWPRDGQPRDVILERPHLPPGVTPSPFAGDWEGLPESTGLDRRTRLHVAQSSDRAFTVCMDRFMLLVDQRHGELLRLESIDHDTITLDTTNPAGVRDRYRGTLSADESTLVGTWGGTPTGRTFNASTRFRRTP